MLEFTYHLDIASNSYPFGVLFENRLYILEENQKLESNPELLKIIDSLPSFRVFVDSGNATARLENGYWYLYKKRKGVLYKLYLGKSAIISEPLLTEIVRTLNTMTSAKFVLTPLTQNVDRVPINGCEMIKPTVPFKSEPYELAGYGKSENHLQPNLIPVDEEIAMLRAEVESLKGYIKQQTNSNIVLGEELRAVQRDRLKIIKERDAIAKEFADYQDKNRNVGLAVAVAGQRMTELENTIEALRQDLVNHRDEATKYHNELEQCQWEASRREDQVSGYYFMHEELSEQVFKYRTLIEKYRLLAKGKDKRNHPRYAYLIDFLAEIDNLSL